MSHELHLSVDRVIMNHKQRSSLINATTHAGTALKNHYPTQRRVQTCHAFERNLFRQLFAFKENLKM